MTTADVLIRALPFVWLGMVGAISFVETPLKFRAPGVSLAIGLGIGRVVFGALGRIELVLLAVLAALLAASSTAEGPEAVVLLILGLLVLTQVVVLRPRLARRSDAVIAGETVPTSHLHLAFIALDVAKLVALGALGTLLIVGGHS